jgi:hypothetical protein
MLHGVQSNETSPITAENVSGSPRITPANVGTIVQEEERGRVFGRLKQVLEECQNGKTTQFQTLSNLVEELEKWVGVSDEERGRAFGTYQAEILALAPPVTVPEEGQSVTQATTQPAGTPLTPGPPHFPRGSRDEIENIIGRVTKRGPEDDELEDESRNGKRRLREEDMPWYDSGSLSSRRASCLETCRTLRMFSEDLSGAKSYLRVAHNLPEGIPASQWDRILKGESVDLNQILSSMHFVQLDEERKGRMGNSEIIFAASESKRHIKIGAEWSAAFRRMSKGIAFLFPHRREELFEYADYIEGLFAAKQSNAHTKVILFDQSVRNQVGGGQNTLLTDYHRFSGLTEAILHADGVEYGSAGANSGVRRAGGARPGAGQGKTGGGKKETCRRFNGQNGCKFSEEECFYKHVCQNCGKGGHGKQACSA